MGRFTIDFNDENDRQLDELVQEQGVRSKADVIRKAIGLLAYAVEEKKEGSRMIFENKREGLRKEVVTL